MISVALCGDFGAHREQSELCFIPDERESSVNEKDSAGISQTQAVKIDIESVSNPDSEIKFIPPDKSDSKETDPEPHRIRLMSWNIDGLDENYILERTKEVCATIRK